MCANTPSPTTAPTLSPTNNDDGLGEAVATAAVGVIVGSIFGVLCFIGICGLLIYLVYKKQKPSITTIVVMNPADSTANTVNPMAHRA